jgi:lysozyme
MSLKTSQKGIELIKAFEGCKLKSYKCPASVWTIGYGNTFYLDGSKVLMGQKISQIEADMLMLKLLPKYEATVIKNIKVILNQNQFDALVSFCWNCGSSETLFRLINQKSSDELIYQFWTTHYIKGGGKVLAGLVRRRKTEADLFIKK